MYNIVETLTNADVREANKKNVFQLFRKNRNLTKKEISTQLEISFPTASQIVDELVTEGYVYETGTHSSTGGRRPKCFSFITGAKITVGLEITINTIRILLVDLSGNQLGKLKIYRAFENSVAYWSFIKDQISVFTDQFSPNKDTLSGIGIAFPGTVSIDGKRIEQTSLDCNNAEISADNLGSIFGVETILVNTGNAAGFAELWNSRHFSHMFYLSIDKSINGAVLFNNELYNGFNNKAGTIAHMTIMANGGRACSCGNTGCFETYCSTKCLTDPLNFSLPVFFEKLSDGDANVKNVWEEYLHYLSIGIRNIRNMFDMAIVLGGELSDYLDEHTAELRERVISKNNYSETNVSFLTLSHYHSNASAIGAALMYIDKFLDSNF